MIRLATPSADRRIGIRARSDLSFSRAPGSGHWIVKDPVALRHFELNDEGYFLLTLLDGRLSIQQICDACARRFAPRRILANDVYRLLVRLHSQGLVISETPGQARVLELRGREQVAFNRTQRFSNPLMIRFRGIDAERLINATYPAVRVLFTRSFLVFVLALAVTAIGMIVMNWSGFVHDLAANTAFLTSQSFWCLLVVIAVVKVLHELGHAFVCRHFGGLCHEIGLLLIFFMPSLYCNVSDSWTFQSKWHRIAVSAAGIGVEMLAAAAATVGWRLSPPGLFHQICLTIIVVCSFNTLILNGNPLLKYDGYYLLADLIELPDLAERANATLWRLLRRILTGIGDDHCDTQPRISILLLSTYAVCAIAYRVGLMLTIASLLISRAEPFQFDNVVRWVLYAMTLISAARYLRGRPFASSPEAVNCRTAVRLTIRVGVFCGAGLAFFLIPLPRAVHGTAEIALRDSTTIITSVPGRLSWIGVVPGQFVARGTTIAQLTNEDLELECLAITSSLARAKSQLDASLRERFESTSASARVSTLRERVRSLERQLGQSELEFGRLTFTAAQSGVIFDGENHDFDLAPSETLNSWTGRLLDERNLNCTVAEGTLVCEIGRQDCWQAKVTIDHADRPFVEVGQRVELAIEGLSGQILKGFVRDIATIGLESSGPRSEHSHHDESATTLPVGGKRQMLPAYEMTVHIEAPPSMIKRGVRGNARVTVVAESIASRITRWTCRTFLLRL